MAYDPKNSPVTVLEREGYRVVYSPEYWGPNPKLYGLHWRSEEDRARAKAYYHLHLDRIREEMIAYHDDIAAGLRRPPPEGWPECRRDKKCTPLCPNRRGHFCP